jgi:glycosyltransferase involved in cell wall biosynthesis
MDKAVLIIGTFLSAQGGNYSVCEDLSLALETQGWTVFTSSTLSQRALRPLDMLLTAWRHRKRYQLSIIDVYSGTAFYWAEWTAKLCRFLKKPYILVLRGGNLPEFAKANRQRVDDLFNNAARVITLSNYLAEQTGLKSELFQTIPNPIHLEHYSYRPRSHAEARLLYLRAFHKVYNPSLALHALKELVAEFPEIRLTMVGPDKGDGAFQEFAATEAALGLGEHVKVIAGVPKAEVPEQFAEYDIFVNTTNIDNTPVSVLEAMASGLCVVSTNVGGIPYLLEDEKDALLVPPNEPVAMAAAIRRLINEPELAARISSNGRKKAASYGWSELLDVWETLLLEVLENRKSSR